MLIYRHCITYRDKSTEDGFAVAKDTNIAQDIQEKRVSQGYS